MNQDHVTAPGLRATANMLGDWLGSSDLMADEISDHGIDVILRWLKDRADSLEQDLAEANERAAGYLERAIGAEADRDATLAAQHVYRSDAEGEYECSCGVAGVAEVVHQAAVETARDNMPSPTVREHIDQADHIERTFTRERARDIGFGDPYEVVTAIIAELRR